MRYVGLTYLIFIDFFCEIRIIAFTSVTPIFQDCVKNIIQ